MFGYFGAKHRTARRYPKPLHDLIIEPFAGAAGYACYWLANDSTKTALLIEKDPRVVEAWQRILSSTPLEIASWPFPVVGERTTDQILAGMAGAGSARPNDCVITERMAEKFARDRRRIAWLRGLIGDRIDVIRGDYKCAPDLEATWFVDPPYQHQGNLYRHGSSAIDYQRLGDWSQSRPGQTIVCEASPADWLPFRPFYTHRSVSDTYNTELIWESDPDPTLFS